MDRGVVSIVLAVMLAACAGEPVATPEPAPETIDAVDPAACLPEGHTRESLAELKAGGFVIDDEALRANFAMAIAACLASPDPVLRDGVAYEALTTLMRERQIAPETMQALRVDLEARLESEDAGGFEAPFAALVLSEVVRADRIQPFMTAAELDTLTQKSARYVTGVNDYRGFDPVEGWRHGVAHGADLLMQLALNPRVPRKGLEQIRGAVAAQAGPTTHAYTHGEGERLARPILMTARRGVFTEQEWTDWFAQAAGPGSLRTWEGVYASQPALARKHNLFVFLSALHVNASLGEDAGDDVILPGVEAALRTLP